MATEIERILNQLDRSFRAEAWHGSAVLEVLADLDATRAAAHPIPGAHSIWELVLHMAYWKDMVRRRLAGERPATDEALNFPVVRDSSPAAWARALETLTRAHEELRAEIARQDDAMLDEPAPGGTVARYVPIHGVVQHDLYHAGQIALLKKRRAKAAPKKTPAGSAKRAAGAGKRGKAPRPRRSGAPKPGGGKAGGGRTRSAGAKRAAGRRAGRSPKRGPRRRRGAGGSG